ncbi:P-loop NTPase fold protein [Muriicola sp. E247]|uniref:P-loop NTPase fold protein n=1 Tax=Muriicola sp. E247 TaxID=3242730 RepID=UPI003524F68C
MWNDNETQQDLIDFKYLTDSVNLIINNDNLVPSTIGVYGDWGSGKSPLSNIDY